MRSQLLGWMSFLVPLLAGASDGEIIWPQDDSFSIGGGIKQLQVGLFVGNDRYSKDLISESHMSPSLLIGLYGFDLSLTFPVALTAPTQIVPNRPLFESIRYDSDSFSFSGLLVDFSNSEARLEKAQFSSRIRLSGDMPLRYLFAKSPFVPGHHHGAFLDMSWAYSLVAIFNSSPFLDPQSEDLLESARSHSLSVGGGYGYAYVHGRVVHAISGGLARGLDWQSFTRPKKSHFVLGEWRYDIHVWTAVLFSPFQTMSFSMAYGVGAQRINSYLLKDKSLRFQLGYTYSF